MKVCALNVRGINKSLKRTDLRSFLVNNNISIAGILESKIHENKAVASLRAVHNFWTWVTNHDFHLRGRICVGWNPQFWNVFVESKSDQYIHCKATLLSTQEIFYFTFIYASNSNLERYKLWADLEALDTCNLPWAMLGDFNTIQDINETCGGNEHWTTDMQSFKDFLTRNGLSDVRSIGPHHTWWNKQSLNPITRKLDRIIGDPNWMLTQQNADAEFTHWGLSDHCASILHLKNRIRSCKKQFQFYNYWIEHPNFMQMVREAWSANISGNPMYILAQKLKLVKNKLVTLQKNEGPIQVQVQDARTKLCSIQEEILRNPFDKRLHEEERNHSMNLWTLLNREEKIAHQRARVQWLALGDQNTAYFHKRIASNWNKSKILSLVDANGTLLTDKEAIKQEAVHHYKNLFSAEMHNYPGIDMLSQLLSKRISTVQAHQLVVKANDQEIFDILKSMRRNRSPGPDGFNVDFFIAAWEIVGKDFTKAIHSFLDTGTLPHYINATTLAVIPKCQNPTTMADFRPISCCNTIYKCLSKLIARRFSKTLPDLVDKSQAAFVKGRSISDNILLAQELLNGYNPHHGVPKATFKLDLHKAFDTCHWQFILDVLIIRGYPPHFIRWIHSCLSTARFSVRINGESEGYFSSSRGIRQGDPISPFLFVIVMDALSEMLDKVKSHPNFKLHHKMEQIELNHLCFADDLMLFCRGEENSIKLLMETLNTFFTFSGLRMNTHKSTCYLSNPPPGLKSWIVDSLGIQMGLLPAKFLGVPLITQKLKKADCIPLITKITSRVDSWTAIYLSLAGRLQLVHSVLQAIYSYWCMHFLLPKGVINHVQMLLSRFLWNGSSAQKSKAKVAWDQVTLPVEEGGLGIKDAHEWNKCLILKHLISIVSPMNTSSLWANWVKLTIIRGTSFWIAKKPSKCSWILRKVMDYREIAKQHITYEIGNGRSISLWFDPWYNGMPLCTDVSDPIISNCNMHRNARVSEILTPEGWILPTSNYHHMYVWRQNFQFNTTFNLNKKDSILWDGVSSKSIRITSLWSSIRHRGTLTEWAASVWHKLKVPRFSCHHWLIQHARLFTLSRLKQIGTVQIDYCYLCINNSETNEHLFLECPFTQFLFNQITKDKCNSLPSSWTQWQTELTRFKEGDIHAAIRVLIFQVGAYNIWRERNNRYHRNEITGPTNLAMQCIDLIRGRLQSSKWFELERTKCNALAVWTSTS